MCFGDVLTLILGEKAEHGDAVEQTQGPLVMFQIIKSLATGNVTINPAKI